MNEDYVSYELAVKLKECGFDEPCDSYYNKACAADDEYWHTKREELINWNGLGSDCQISAPTLWQAQKWLREKKKELQSTLSPTVAMISIGRVNIIGRKFICRTATKMALNG